MPQRSRRDCWPLVADALFLVIGDDWGKLRMHRDVAKLALAGAVLSELMLGGYATIERDLLIPTSAGRPIDPLAAAVFEQVRAEHQELSVRKWLAFLATVNLGAEDLYDNVGRRLERAGRVVSEQRGAPWRRYTRFVPADSNDAGWAWGRISDALRRHEVLTTQDVVCAGLMHATGLYRYVLLGDRVEEQLDAHVAHAPADIRALIRHTQDAFTSKVNTGN